MIDILELEARAPDAVLRYGDAPQHVADLYRADRSPADLRAADLVVVVHGGFWRDRYDRAHVRPLAAALADHGYDVLLPEYRRVGDPGGGWPGTADDVVAVVEALPTLVPSVAARRIVLVGHSAGGHLAVWSQAVHPSGRIDAVVSLAGVVDLQAAADARLSDDAVVGLLGGAALEGADPLQLAAPPMPLTLVHGADDAVVPVAHSRDYAAAHPGARLLELPGTGHFELVDPRGAAFATLLDVLAR